MYTYIPVVGPAGPSGSCPPPRVLRGVGPAGSAGIWGRKHIRESGPLGRDLGQARRGDGPAGSAGSQARSQTTRAHRHIQKQQIGPTGFRVHPLGCLSRRLVGELVATGASGRRGGAGSSGSGPVGASGRSARQRDGLPDLGARRKWWNCNVAGNCRQ